MNTVMQSLRSEEGPSAEPSFGDGSEAHGSWRLRRRVLPQHTDHGGVMWHGAYLGWLEEARVEALAAVGMAYSALACRGLELPVVALAIDYRQGLQHGDLVEVRSALLPRRGVRLPWRSCFLTAGGGLAAEARVDLVVVERLSGQAAPRVVRRLPADLAEALVALAAGPRRPV